MSLPVFPLRCVFVGRLPFVAPRPKFSTHGYSSHLPFPVTIILSTTNFSSSFWNHQIKTKDLYSTYWFVFRCFPQFWLRLSLRMGAPNTAPHCASNGFLSSDVLEFGLELRIFLFTFAELDVPGWLLPAQGQDYVTGRCVRKSTCKKNV